MSSNSGTNAGSGSGGSSGGSSNRPSSSNTGGTPTQSRLTRNLAIVAATDRDFAGNVPEIGAFGMPLERNMVNVKPLPQFQDNLGNFCGRTMKGYDDMKCLITQFIDPVATLQSKRPKRPKKPTYEVVVNIGDGKDADLVKKAQEQASRNADLEDDYMEKLDWWKMEGKKFLDRDDLLRNNITNVFSLVLGQCTEAVCTELKTEPDYETKVAESDALWLLECLKKIEAGINHNHNACLTGMTKLREAVNCIQGPTETSESYKERLTTCFDGVKLSLGKDFFQKIDLGNGLSGQDVEDAFLSAWMLQNADRIRHGSRLSELEQRCEVGDDRIPTKLNKAYELIVSNEERLQREQQRYRRVPNGGGRTGTNLYQGDSGDTGGAGRGNGGGRGRGNGGGRGYGRERRTEFPPGVEIVDGTDGQRRIILCDFCNRWGHGWRQCPTRAQVCQVIPNGNGGNGGQGVDLDFLPLTVHHNPSSVANVLSCHDLDSIPGAYVYHNGKVDQDFYLIFDSGRVIRFIHCEEGRMYYYDADKPENHEMKMDGLNLAQTLVDRRKAMETMSKADVLRAQKARSYQELLVFPSTADFRDYVENTDVENLNITVEDVDRSVVLFGEPVASIRGKFKRPTPNSHGQGKTAPLAPSLRGTKVDVYADIMHIEGQMFLVCKARRVDYTKSYPLPNKNIPTVLRRLRVEIRKLKRRGFDVDALHIDNAFNTSAVENGIYGVRLEPYATQEHVGYIENEIKFIKERVRCVLATMPFEQVPKLVVLSAVKHVTETVNRLPRGKDLAAKVSPAYLVEGRSKLDFSQKMAHFGRYAEVWTGTDNTMKERTVPAIVLNRSNDTGGHYFMSLETGRRLHSYGWQELPMTDDIVKRVEALTKSPISMQVLVERLTRDIERRNDDDEVQDDNTSTETESVNENNSNNEIMETEASAPEVEDVVPGDEDDGIEELEVLSLDVMIENENERPARISDVTSIGDISNSIGENDEMNEIMEEEVRHEYEYESDFEDVTGEAESEEGGPTLYNEDIRMSTEPVVDTESQEAEPMDVDVPLVHEATGRDVDMIGTNEGGINASSETSSDPSEQQKEPLQSVKRKSETVETNTRSKRKVMSPEELERWRNCYQPGNNLFQSTAEKSGVSGFNLMQTKYKDAVNMIAAKEFIQKPIWKSRKRLADEKDDQKTVNGCRSMLGAAVRVLFAQMSVNKGIDTFGEKAIAAMIKELTQLDQGAVPGKPVTVPIDPKTLTAEDKKKALNAVNLVEEKRDGKIKGRTCADGSKQRRYLNEYDSVASPTVSLEGLMATLVIGAHEGRSFGSFDVPGAFLQAELSDDKLVLLKLRGAHMVDMMCEVNPAHKANVVYENGTKVIYMQVIRAIYGCIESALAWYQLFTTTLEKEGFVLNPYDKCVANKMVDGKQLTIAWHVDDCLMSHVDKKVLEVFGKKMIEYFGEMEITIGENHSFLGMEIEVKDGIVKISMKKQIQKIIDDFEADTGEVLDETVASIATHGLYSVDENAADLDKARTEIFHSVTAKLLYIMKRVRPDIETAVSFLMRRVSKSNTEDWKKLKRCLGFVKGTKDDVRYIGARSLTEILTWVDAAFAVHDNMRSHMGGGMSMGIGLLHGKSSMEKINVKSSTEAELVALAEYLPYNLWLLMFLREQGYEIANNVIFQDNKSAILIEKNGRNSCTGNSRHIDVRYFFVKDRIDKGDVRVEYLPTKLMLADYFTKPLQGELFRKLREYVMGWRPVSELLIQHENTSLKEGVGNQNVSNGQNDSRM